MFYAQECAQAAGESFVGPEHILVGVLQQDNCNAVAILRHAKQSEAELLDALNQRIGRKKGSSATDMTLTPFAKRLIDHAYDEARNLQHNYIGTEHILLGVFRLQKGLAHEILKLYGVTHEKLRLSLVALGLAEDSPPPLDKIPPGNRATAQDLLCALTGAGIQEHLLITIVHRSEPAPALRERERFTQSLIDSLQAKSARGIGFSPVESLDELLLEAGKVADGHPITSQHLSAALIIRNPELAKCAAECGWGSGEANA